MSQNLREKQSMSRQGFTLIELVIVIVIMGIMAVSVITSGTSKGSVRLNAACYKLAADLRYAQEMAMAEQVRFGISFDTDDESYFAYRVSTGMKALDPQTRDDLEVEFDEMREFNDIVISSIDFSDAIEFGSMGEPYDGNGVALSSEGIVTLQTADGVYSMTVRIEPVTGKVTVQ